MKHIAVILGFLCLALPCFSEELVIADKHSSNYQIVLPDNVGDEDLLKFVSLGGRLIQNAIKNASGAELPLVGESRMAAGKPAIYVGDTKALAAAGLSAADFAQWEHAIAIKGNDIYIYGTDWPSVDKNRRAWYPYITLGSLKASFVFAEKFLNTRVVGMDRNNNDMERIWNCVHTLPKERITVPEDFAYRFKPRFLNSALSDAAGVLYMVANNHLHASGASFDVHYHTRAIPQDKYYGTHPEYFALVKGRRYYHRVTPGDGSDGFVRPQYCLSNPEVQELIYQEALSRADNGCRVVEFGQSDGFIPCECENCKKMYDTDDWGEKLWCLHRDLSARLKAERPNVQVAIACYGPTNNIPKSFDKFPVDMVIDAAPARPELVKEWEKFNLVGMACWTYFTGSYRPCGYSPCSSFEDLHKENRYLRSTPISYLYNCGLWTAKALSGPWIYAWGRWYVDENEDADTILRDYCLYSFGEKAAPCFEKFFRLIDDRMVEFPIEKAQDFNDFSQRGSSAINLWQKRYPTEVLAQLTEYFEAGVKLCEEGNTLIPPLKTEFEYLKLSSTVCNALKKWKNTMSDEDRIAVADALEARNNFIKSLPLIQNGTYIAGPGFEYEKPAELLVGGFMRGIFGDVFDKDPEMVRRVMPAGKAVPVKDFDDPAWKDAQEYGLVPLKAGYQKVDARFQVGYTADAFLFRISSPLSAEVDSTPVAHDGDLWKSNDVKELFLGTDNGMVRMAFTPVEGSAFDAIVTSRERTDETWNCEWTHADRVEDGVWYSDVTIPFKSAGFAFVPGKKLFLQVGLCQKSGGTAYGWNVPETGRFVDVSGFGKLQVGEPKRESFKSKVADWQVSSPKNDAEFTSANGGCSLKWQGEPYCSIQSDRRRYLENGQAAKASIILCGKGKVNVYLAWYDAKGAFVCNDKKIYTFDLSETAETKNFVFNGDLGNMGKGGAYFRLSVVLLPPGGEVVVESAEIETPLP